MPPKLAAHRKEEEKEFEKEEKLLTLDSAGYHPEDKNFKYYAQYTGEALIGFLGSPNLKHSGHVSCAAVSPEGKWIISGSYDATLKLWDVQSGKELRTFKGHVYAVESVCFAPGGKAILSGSDDHTLKLWGIKTGTCIKTIPLLWRPFEIQFQPGSPGLFATANGNGTVTFFDIREILEDRMPPGNSN